MTWEQDMNRFTAKLEGVSKELLPNVASALYESIVEGSAVTGAPGQPVGQYGPGYHEGEVGGNLKTSWQITFPSLDTAQVSTNVIYAPFIEDGISWRGTPLTLRSSVGGWHSVKITMLNAQRLVDRIASEGQRPEGFQQNYVLNSGATY